MRMVTSPTVIALVSLALIHPLRLLCVRRAARQGYWVLVGTSLGRVHRLGPLMAETADRAPEIMQLGPAKDKGGWLPLSFFGGRKHT